MIQQILGFVWEIALLGIAIYFYAYMRGFIKGKTPEQEKKINEFRAANKWLLYITMLLGAIMVLNITLRIIQMMGN
ncbi:MAG: hypothetical protein ACI97N_001720 [Cognaticolwellia sp.]|jgi:hypothetical protein